MASRETDEADIFRYQWLNFSGNHIFFADLQVGDENRHCAQ